MLVYNSLSDIMTIGGSYVIKEGCAIREERAACQLVKGECREIDEESAGQSISMKSEPGNQ